MPPAVVPYLSAVDAPSASCALPVKLRPVGEDPVTRRCCEKLHEKRHVSSYESRCIECLLRRRRTFFIGRTGMGHESWTACLAVTNNANTTYWPIIRKHLTYKNGVPTANTSDAMGPVSLWSFVITGFCCIRYYSDYTHTAIVNAKTSHMISSIW